jgi:hypothetical protein
MAMITRTIVKDTTITFRTVEEFLSVAHMIEK